MTTDQAIGWPIKYDTLGVGVSGTTYADVVAALVQAAQCRRPAIVDFMPVSVLIEAARYVVGNSRFVALVLQEVWRHMRGGVVTHA